MIELNLLPKDLKVVPKKKKTTTNITLPKVAPVPLIISAISIILVSQLILGLFSVAQTNKLAKLSKEINQLSPQEAIAAALKKEVDELDRKFSVIDSLTSSSLIWSKKLYDLSSTLTEGVWLTSLYLTTEASEPQGGTPASQTTAYTPPQQMPPRQVLVLQGSAVSQSPGEEAAVVGKFMESLRNSKDFFADFEDIKLSSIQRKKLGAIEVMDFTVVCYFKKGRNYFEKLESRDIA
jgi:Tfp pilus assembly protein PilN